MNLTDLTTDRVPGGETFTLYAINLHTDPPRNGTIIEFTARDTEDAVDAVIEDLLEWHEADYFPFKLFGPGEKDVTSALSNAMWDTGIIKLTKTESQGKMKTHGKTITMETLKRLVGERGERDDLIADGFTVVFVPEVEFRNSHNRYVPVATFDTENNAERFAEMLNDLLGRNGFDGLVDKYGKFKVAED